MLNYNTTKNTGRCSWMELAMSEMKVHNEVPVLDSIGKNLGKWKSTTRSTRKLTKLFKLCCNVFCHLAEWFTYLLCQAIHKCESIKPLDRMDKVGSNNEGAIYFHAFPTVTSSKHCCVVSFMNASILLESWFTFSELFAPIIADMTILYSHKVLKAFNHHLNCKCKFTLIIGKITGLLLIVSLSKIVFNSRDR